MYNPIKHELQLIISGAGKVSFGTTIQTASRYLGKGTPSSPKAENPKQIRKQEAEKLKKFISDNNLWINEVDFTRAGCRLHLHPFYYLIYASEAFAMPAPWTEH